MKEKFMFNINTLKRILSEVFLIFENELTMF